MVHDQERSIQQLISLRSSFREQILTRHEVTSLVQTMLALLFPHFATSQEQSSAEGLRKEFSSLQISLISLCKRIPGGLPNAPEITSNFIQALPELHRILCNDAEAIFKGDPAAKSIDEVILSYPGFTAIAVYRLAHQLHLQGLPIIPRMMTEYAHQTTGIDIHPGASIGNTFVIDHGTGIVIGETTIIEDDVKLYQGVTLGALSVDKSFAGSKRHPTIEKGVVIYANATILGGETVIGAGSIIGGNVWLTASVPAGSRVYHRADLTVKGPASHE